MIPNTSQEASNLTRQEIQRLRRLLIKPHGQIKNRPPYLGSVLKSLNLEFSECEVSVKEAETPDEITNSIAKTLNIGVDKVALIVDKDLDQINKNKDPKCIYKAVIFVSNLIDRSIESLMYDKFTVELHKYPVWNIRMFPCLFKYKHEMCFYSSGYLYYSPNSIRSALDGLLENISDGSNETEQLTTP